MPTAYATASAAQLGTEIVAAPGAKTKRIIQQAYVNVDTAMKVTLWSGYSDEIQAVYTNATGGTFTLTYAGQTTAATVYDANAALIDTRISALSNVTSVTVTGAGTLADPWLVTFVDPGGQDIALMTGDASSLTGVTSTIATDTAGVDAVDEIQSLYNGADGGTFTITYSGQETAAIAYNANATAINDALELLSNITAVGVSGAGTSGDPWIITFTDPGGQNIDEITTDDTSLTNGTSTIATDTAGVANVDEVQSVYTNAGSGDFTLTYSGQTTAAIAYDASATLMDTRITALSNVTDVAVTGTGTATDPWIVTFSNPAGAIDEMTATDTGLVEVLAISEASAGEGTELAAFHLGTDGVATLPYSQEGWMVCGAAEAVTFSSDTSGNVAILLGYDTVGGS